MLRHVSLWQKDYLTKKQMGKVSIILSAFLGAFHVLIIAKCQIAVDKIVGLSSREQRNV